MNFIDKYNAFDKKKVITKFTSKMKIRGGDGGSANIIFIDKDCVYKIIPFFVKHPNSKYRFNGDQREIDIYRMLTKEFVLSNKTPHIVGYYHAYKTDLTNLFIGLPDIKSLYINKQEKINHQLMHMRFDYQNKNINKTADVCVIEKCPLTIEKYIGDIIKKKPKLLADAIHRIIFQVIYTLAVIQKAYPTFVHNDLFLRNILATEETKYSDADYVEYIFDGKKYYLPANGIYIKINDFGYTLDKKNMETHDINNANRRLNRMPNINCQKCDIFNFLHDFYDGEGLGAKSVMSLVDKKKKLTPIVKSAFNKYIDIGIINTINKNNRRLLNRTWSILHLPFLQNTVKIPAHYLKTLRYPLPKNAHIVHSYH